MTQDAPTNKKETHANTVIGDKFACLVLRTLYGRDMMSKKDLLDSVNDSSRRSVYLALDRLIDIGYVRYPYKDRHDAVTLTDKGEQVAELLSKMEAIEREDVRIIDGDRLEKEVKAVFVGATGKEFLENLSIASMVNAIMRDAYPKEKFVPAKRPAYCPEVDVRRPYRGRAFTAKELDVIDKYLDRSELMLPPKGTVEIKLDSPAGIKDTENIWRIAAEMKQKKEQERNQRQYEIVQEMDELLEDIEENFGDSEKLEPLFARYVECNKELGELLKEA